MRTTGEQLLESPDRVLPTQRGFFLHTQVDSLPVPGLRSEPNERLPVPWRVLSGGIEARGRSVAAPVPVQLRCSDRQIRVPSPNHETRSRLWDLGQVELLSEELQRLYLVD